jgi:GxxExxY protein
MAVTLDEVNAISHKVIGCAMEVHKEIGPVVLESAFRQCLCHELHLQHIPFETELSLPVTYKGMNVETGYRMDLLVCGLVVVELKSLESILPVHEAQLMTYLRLGRYPLGLLINYRVKLLRQGGIKRFINSKVISHSP